MRSQKSNVLQHPTFGGPAVVNLVFRGVKKGCPSLGNARRKKLGEDRRQAEEAQAVKESAQREISDKQMDIFRVCQNILDSVFSGECEGLMFCVQRNDRHTFGAVGSYKHDKALAKKISSEMFVKYRDTATGAPVLQLVGGAK